MYTLVFNARSAYPQSFATMGEVQAEIKRRVQQTPFRHVFWYVVKEVMIEDLPRRVVIAQSRNGTSRHFNTTIVLATGMTRITLEYTPTPFGTLLGRWRAGTAGNTESDWSQPMQDSSEHRLGRRLVIDAESYTQQHAKA